MKSIYVYLVVGFVFLQLFSNCGTPVKQPEIWTPSYADTVTITDPNKMRMIDFYSRSLTFDDYLSNMTDTMINGQNYVYTDVLDSVHILCFRTFDKTSNMLQHLVVLENNKKILEINDPKDELFYVLQGPSYDKKYFCVSQYFKSINNDSVTTPQFVSGAIINIAKAKLVKYLSHRQIVNGYWLNQKSRWVVEHPELWKIVFDPNNIEN